MRNPDASRTHVLRATPDEAIWTSPTRTRSFDRSLEAWCDHELKTTRLTEAVRLCSLNRCGVRLLMNPRLAVLSFDIPRARRLAKEGSWIVVGQITSVLGAVVLVRVLTEYLDPTQYGQLALGLTVAGLVNRVVMGGVNNGISRYYSIAAEKQDLPSYLSASRRLMLYAALTVLVIGLTLLVGLWSLGYSQWMGLAAAALMFSASDFLRMGPSWLLVLW